MKTRQKPRMMALILQVTENTSQDLRQREQEGSQRSYPVRAGRSYTGNGGEPLPRL